MKRPEIEKLKEIQNRPLKYSQLCEELGLERKSHNSKTAQLKTLQTYCDLVTLSKPTRYMVKEIYDDEILAFTKVSSNNKFQIMFDAVIYQAFLENGGQTLYLSTTEMLKLFAEVNENFVYACNGEQMFRLGENYLYFAEIGQVAKKILIRWTRNRIDSMEGRKLLNKSKAYRLYTRHKGKYGFFKIGHNFKADTEIGKRCLTVMSKAYEESVPVDYKDSKWLPNYIYQDLNDNIAVKTKKEFEKEEYVDLREIVALSPPTKERVCEKLCEIYRTVPALHEINAEACRKILATSQLDKFTGEERKRFIEVNMNLKPKEYLKSKVEAVKEEMLKENDHEI